MAHNVVTRTHKNRHNQPLQLESLSRHTDELLTAEACLGPAGSSRPQLVVQLIFDKVYTIT